MKRIVVGSLYQETNSFSPVITGFDSFIIQRGPEMLDKLAAAGIFRESGAELIPTLAARSLPSGRVEEKCYLDLKNHILDSIPGTVKIDGVYLYLHGAMEVENVGSGEALLVSEIRKKIGPEVPIAIALDFHANNTEKLMDSANIIYGYRTVPHVDEKETQIRTAEMLLECIDKGFLPRPAMVRLPLLFPGEMATTGVEPLRTLIKKLDDMEKEEDILCASIFTGMPWVDASNSGASVVVTGRKGTGNARREAARLAGMLWEARGQFHYEEETAEPEAAIERAVDAKECPVFISDSGDNVTAGAAGDNGFLLELLIKKEVRDTLVAGITDKAAVDACLNHTIGDIVKFSLGAELDKTGERIDITGILKKKGVITDKGGKHGTRSVIVSMGGIDVIITENRHAFVSPEIIESAGVEIGQYKLIAVKLGYLYDALRRISARSIIALTPGTSSLALQKLDYCRIARPIYPLDRDFEWKP